MRKTTCDPVKSSVELVLIGDRPAIYCEMTVCTCSKANVVFVLPSVDLLPIVYAWLCTRHASVVSLNVHVLRYAPCL